MQEYLKNRVAFPLDELAKHRGEWVADGDDLTPTQLDLFFADGKGDPFLA